MVDFDGAGERALSLARQLSYVREAGTEPERRAAGTFARELRACALDPALEPFSFETRVQTAAGLAVTAPYEKTYPVSAYLGAGDTPPDGVSAPFVYVEDGDEVSLSLAGGCIAMVLHILCRSRPVCYNFLCPRAPLRAISCIRVSMMETE